MSEAYKCDLCKRYADNAYDIPHPAVRDVIQVCTDCYQSFLSIYVKWLKERGWKNKAKFDL